MPRPPNILIIQADQLAPRALPAYGNAIARTPHIDWLAANGTVFENAYCNYPLCAPSRMSMMTGLLPANAGAYDNGAEFPAALPTFVHYLRLAGYQTALAGKMHFIGPDQLHGFEERLTTDIYPSDFNWTANWDSTVSGSERLLAAAGEVNGILNSGIYERTVQLDYDEEVGFRTRRKLFDLARSDDDRPFCLFASFTNPHDPFAIPKRYWERYRHDAIDMPSIPAMARADLDRHSQRLFDHIGVAEAAMTPEDVRVARHAYYGAVSFIDDQVGELLEALRTTGRQDDTLVLFTSDHGEALGERGLWFKRSFFDCAVKVPLIAHMPAALSGNTRATRRPENVSLVDLLPTLVEVATGAPPESFIETPFDGRSLKPALEGGELPEGGPVIAEMSGEGLQSPSVMVVHDGYKYIACPDDPPLLFESGSSEQVNLADHPDHRAAAERFARFVDERWDLPALKEQVLLSQRRRRLVDRAHQAGRAPSWDYDVPVSGAAEYFRPTPANPSASNYNDAFEVRARPQEQPGLKRDFP